MSLLDPRFKYVPAISTDVLATFRRFGFQPTSDEERRARLARHGLRPHKLGQPPVSYVTPLARESMSLVWRSGRR
ncbi:MAG: hypothetical protein ACKVQU_14660 [Burkholderiales bacterium]